MDEASAWGVLIAVVVLAFIGWCVIRTNKAFRDGKRKQ